MKLARLLFLSTFAISSSFGQTGCTDPLALNFSPVSTQNDGSCIYASANVDVNWSVNLSPILLESSCLFSYNDNWWTSNDNFDSQIYQFDSVTGNVENTLNLPLQNSDWEEIQQDENYFYIADFGNNNGGNRTNLKIYSIEKSSILSMPVIDSIQFYYPEQSDFSYQSQGNITYDCEAFVVMDDHFLLFTKSWSIGKSIVYSIPKIAGNYPAEVKDTLQTSGLITGAYLHPSENLIVLSGYSTALTPFVYTIYNLENEDFSKANKRKIGINLPFHQVEGISSLNGLDYFITNEKFTYTTIDIPPKISKFSLKPFLKHFFNLDLGIPENQQLYYCVDNCVNINQMYIGKRINIFSIDGKLIYSGKPTNHSLNMNYSGFVYLQLID